MAQGHCRNCGERFKFASVEAAAQWVRRKPEDHICPDCEEVRKHVDANVPAVQD